MRSMVEGFREPQHRINNVTHLRRTNHDHQQHSGFLRGLRMGEFFAVRMRTIQGYVSSRSVKNSRIISPLRKPLLPTNCAVTTQKP